MAKKRDLKLDNYGISKWRYRELYYFCLQYKDFIEALQDCYSLDGVSTDGKPNERPTPEPIHTSGKRYKSDPTVKKAERAYMLSRDIEMIEQTAIEATGDLYQYMLTAVSENLSWEILQPPCGRRQFYKARRKFFFLLSLKKG